MRMNPVLLLAFALAACSTQESSGGSGTAGAGDRIECRIGGAAQFDRFCTVERDGADLTVRKPDGGFRRLRIVADGRGVEAADGAQPAVVTLLADRRIEVAIGGDAFRLPATVRPQ
jgi:hypothetical protein